jgi:hypothetical protein
MGLVLLALLNYRLLPSGDDLPELKRLETETDRLLTEISRLPGGIRGPNQQKLERLLEELGHLYQQTRYLEKKVQEGTLKGNEQPRSQNQLAGLQALAARQWTVLAPYWSFQFRKKNVPR